MLGFVAVLTLRLMQSNLLAGLFYSYVMISQIGNYDYIFFLIKFTLLFFPRVNMSHFFVLMFGWLVFFISFANCFQTP